MTDNRSKYISLLAAVAVGLYALYGVLFRQWHAADIYFWFWCEFMLSGITTFIIIRVWLRRSPNVPRIISQTGTLAFIGGFLVVLFYASLFAGVAYKGEWKSWHRFPEFLEGKTISLALMFLLFGVLLAVTLTGRDYLKQDYNRLMRPFNRRCFIVLGMYAVLMFSYHFGGARKLDLSDSYLEGMSITLIVLKMVAETGLFERLFRLRQKQTGIVGS